MSSADNRRSQTNQIAERIRNILEQGATAVLCTLIAGEAHIGAKMLVQEDALRTGSLGLGDLDATAAAHAGSFLRSREDLRTWTVNEFAPELIALANTEVLFERIQVEPRLVICGAGHVGAALANFGSLLGYQVTVIDDRAEFVARERFPDERIALIAGDSWFDAVREAVSDGRGVSVAVVTRGHSEDEVCLRAVMESGADYVGLIGSKRRTRIVLERLKEAGADEEKLTEVRAPIGLDIGAVTPEEVALAIMAEIVAVRRGGGGTPLSIRKTDKK